ncbi:MAG: recombination-associated protein RdgC [Lentisphaeraceae bacterium]|nr:recombination-associated protein RdgC [Lentisphaeraceae bacterium]
MAFDSGNISFSVYEIKGDLPEDHLEKFSAFAGCLPEKVTDTPNLGWVARHLLERRIDEETAYVGDYLSLNFRSAVRKIPSSLLKAECMQKELAQMQADQVSSLSRKKKKEIKEEVEDDLIKFMPPNLSGVPFVIDKFNKTLYVGTSSVKQSDSLVQLLIETCDVEVIPKTPVGEAMKALETRNISIDPLDFTGKNLSEGDDLLLGRDFLTWIWYKCESDTPKFIVPDVGEFAIGLDGPLNLVSETSGAHETVVRKGLPTMSPEAHSGINSGKKLKSAKISMARGDDVWTFTLDADNFIFKSMKLPDGEAMDRISRFEERIEALDTFQQAYFSLYSDFIKMVAGKDRKEHLKDIQDWTTTRMYQTSES